MKLYSKTISLITAIFSFVLSGLSLVLAIFFFISIFVGSDDLKVLKIILSSIAILALFILIFVLIKFGLFILKLRRQLLEENKENIKDVVNRFNITYLCLFILALICLIYSIVVKMGIYYYVGFSVGIVLFILCYVFTFLDKKKLKIEA